MSDALNVFFGEFLVGVLWLGEKRDFAFRYDPKWLTNDSAIPLSLSLPLRPEAFTDDLARPFFSNLLPESELRRIIARKLGLSEKNDFALLEAVGGECAGAVSLLPHDELRLIRGSYRNLDDAQLNELISSLPKRPMLAGENQIRLSLAGAQNKLPVLFDGQQVSLPMGDAPSTHILKPPIPQYAHTVENEAFCMQLAERMGLTVPKVTILHMASPLYLIERYDRELDKQGEIVRLHQEDFCQALRIPPDMKYEKEGGPSLGQCFDLVRHHSIQPVADLRQMLKWVAFNYLIGNADAHAKNIALMLTAEGPKLAPFYDLMCTVAYPELTDRLAMKIGGEDRPKWIFQRHWERFAEEIGVGFRLVEGTLMEMSELLESGMPVQIDEFQKQHGETEIIGKIDAVIDQRSRKVRLRNPS